MTMAHTRTENPLDVFTDVTLPRWAMVEQRLDDTSVGDFGEAIAREFARSEIRSTIGPGQKVALTAGSRGIDRIAEVLRAVVDQVKLLGAEPFIITAMGSHGGATAEGQREVIAHYGVTEETMGVPIRASMETVHLGTIEGNVPVWFDRIAYEEADVVIPIGRVKPHTSFRGPTESGLMKMLAIGLGKQHGASWFHSHGIGTFGELIPRVAHYTLSQVNIPFGIALVENGLSKMALIEAVPREGMYERECELLDIARGMLAVLPPVAKVDVLIVDEIGKDISGDGADPNVVHRGVANEIDFSDDRPVIQRAVVRGLTQDTEGNASGIGMFDFALRRAVEAMDPIPTYMNMLTAKAPQGAKIPITVENDRQALSLAIASALRVEEGRAKILRIRSTKHLTRMLLSEPLLADLEGMNGIVGIGEPMEIGFDADGMFATEL
jgi:hypothetical protein